VIILRHEINLGQVFRYTQYYITPFVGDLAIPGSFWNEPLHDLVDP